MNSSRKHFYFENKIQRCYGTDPRSSDDSIKYKKLEADGYKIPNYSVSMSVIEFRMLYFVGSINSEAKPSSMLMLWKTKSKNKKN